MPLGKDTFSLASGAVSDIFAGFGAEAKGELQAEGMKIGAEGTRIGAQGTRLTAEGLRIKARGDIAEADNYDLASGLARENLAYTEQSTRVQAYQLGRQVTSVIGGQRASVAAGGFAQGGSAGDILRDSASQGALARGVLLQQGQITEAGYEQQAKSYDTMSAASRAAAASEFGIADKTDTIANQQDQLANRQDQLADRTAQVAKDQGTFDFISGAFKGIAAIGSLFIGGPAAAAGAIGTVAHEDLQGNG